MASLIVRVKGPRKTAQRAAARRGIHATCKASSYGEVNCNVPCGQLTKAMRWYGEKTSSLKQGRGYAPGEVLYFSHGSCPTGSLRGASRRKRRKRR